MRDAIRLGALDIQRTPARHGHGVLAQAMGPASGFVLRRENEPTLYVAGDTVWCQAVHHTLQATRPHVIVLNGGAARLVEGPPVTMNADEILTVARAAGRATIVVVHLEASNACTESRADLRGRLAQQPDLLDPVRILEDGEELSFGPPARCSSVAAGQRRPEPLA